VRAATLARFPGLQRALSPLAGKLTDAEMRRVNAAVDIDGRSTGDVAGEIVERLLGREE
jgi:osmoprotectant transport system permease protein